MKHNLVEEKMKSLIEISVKMIIESRTPIRKVFMTLARASYQAGYEQCWQEFKDMDAFVLGQKDMLERIKELNETLDILEASDRKTIKVSDVKHYLSALSQGDK